MSTPPEDPRRALAEAAAGADETPDPDPLWDIRQRALDYLGSVWEGDSSCPICKSDKWFIANVAVLPIRSGDIGTPAGSDAYPLVPVVCKVCGYTFLFNEQWARAGGPPPEFEAEGNS